MTFENVDFTDLNIEIYNAAGQLVLSKNVTDNPVEIDITEFGSGVYTIIIKDKTRQASRQIIVGK